MSGRMVVVVPVERERVGVSMRGALLDSRLGRLSSRTSSSVAGRVEVSVGAAGLESRTSSVSVGAGGVFPVTGGLGPPLTGPGI